MRFFLLPSKQCLTLRSAQRRLERRRMLVQPPQADSFTSSQDKVINHLPHPEERLKGASRRTQGVCAATHAVYWAINPPSMTSSVPVMNEASSEARNNTP